MSFVSWNVSSVDPNQLYKEVSKFIVFVAYVYRFGKNIQNKARYEAHIQDLNIHIVTIKHWGNEKL